jgi:putative membrane-bound dehydrogenase-like protein
MIAAGLPRSLSVCASALIAVLLMTPLAARQGPARPPQPPTGAGSVARLSSDEARRIAREIRAATNAQLAPGLELALWASGHLVGDPLAIDITPTGVAYVIASPRSSQLVDIRRHPDWVPDVHALETVDDLRTFFKRVMAPELSGKNGWLPDYNGDGSRDWRDLTHIKERIFRIDDTNSDGVADRSLVAFEGFNEDVISDIAGGGLYHDGDLYVAAAPDLWRLSDTNGDGVFDEKKSISHGYSVHPAFTGHDLSAVTLGPDGRIYWKVGDIGMNVVDTTGRRWAYPNQGAVLRANPDGTGFEVFARGLRNTQEIAFDEHGNLVSVDNDGDHQGETERVVYITLGSDAGWRSTWQYGKYTDPNNNRYNVWMDEGLYKPQFNGQAAYIVPPIAPYHAGPSGFAYNPGTALDERFRRHFFVTSFTGNAANARVFAFRLAEKGAGFELAGETEIVRGVLSPGMRIGPDGALYLTDWIRGWGATGEGKIWKIDTPATASSPIRAEVKSLLVADFSSLPVAELRRLLGHADMRVRLKSQFEIVRRGDAATLRAAAGQVGSRLPRLHAVWGLGQLARTNASHASALVPLLTDEDGEVRAQTARTLGDVRHRASAETLRPLLADPAPRVRFFAAEALGRMRDRDAIEPIVRMLAENANRDVYLRNAGMHALESIADVGALTGLSTHQSSGVKLAAVVALRRLKDAGVAEFLNDADELVVIEAARAINDEGGIPAGVPALARVLDRPALQSAALVRRAISANVRTGTAESVERVAAYARRAGAPEPLRIEAIAALGVWARPSTMDRVDGEYLGPAQTRDGAAAQRALAALMPAIDAGSTSSAMKMALIEAAGTIDLDAAAPRLLERVKVDGDASVRAAALRALRQIEAPQVGEAVTVAMGDRDQAVRMAAIAAIGQPPNTESATVEQLTRVIQSGSVGERQSALAGLGTLKGDAARQTLMRLLDEVNTGRVPAAVQLDLFEAAQATAAEPLLARLERIGVGRALERVPEAVPAALLAGGNAQRGRQTAQEHPAAQCVRCHNFGGGSSMAMVGPDLGRIGAALTREQLLESLINPTARIAPGFGVVSITLASGSTVEGLLKAETATTLAIEDATGQRRTVQRAVITRRTDGPSAMPAMGALLRPREIRDVVEFLATLR